MDRLLLRLSGLNGFLAVLMGAFGAHMLEGLLQGQVDAAQRLEWWETASYYHLTHALALAVSAWLAYRVPGRLSPCGGLCFQLGILLFSGSLYAMTLTGARALGMVTPVGGVFLLAGWALLLAGAGKVESRPREQALTQE